MEIKKYIESGVLESYVLGASSESETNELLRLKKLYPEVRDALYELETDMERIANAMAVMPPPGILTRIENQINALIITPPDEPTINNRQRDGYHTFNPGSHFIEVEAKNSHMRVHKTWKWVFAGVFLLSKIFLIAAIYYYLENRQAQEQLQELKTELKQYRQSR